MRFSSRRIHSVTLLRVSFARCFWVKIFRWMDGNLINFCRKTGPCATVVRLVSTVHNNSDSFLMLVWLHQSCTLIFNFVHVFYRQNFYSQQGQCIGFIIRFTDFRISSFCRHCGLQNKDLHLTLKHFVPKYEIAGIRIQTFRSLILSFLTGIKQSAHSGLR